MFEEICKILGVTGFGPDHKNTVNVIGREKLGEIHGDRYVRELDNEECTKCHVGVSWYFVMDEPELQEVFDKVIAENRYVLGSYMCVALVADSNDWKSMHIRHVLEENIRAMAELYGIREVPDTPVGWDWLWAMLELKRRGVDVNNVRERNAAHVRLNHEGTHRMKFAKMSMDIYKDWSNRHEVVLAEFGVPDLDPVFKEFIANGHYHNGGFMCNASARAARANEISIYKQTLITKFIKTEMAKFCRKYAVDYQITWSSMLMAAWCARARDCTSAGCDHTLFNVYANWNNRETIFAEILGE